MRSRFEAKEIFLLSKQINQLIRTEIRTWKLNLATTLPFSRRSQWLLARKKETQLVCECVWLSPLQNEEKNDVGVILNLIGKLANV